MVTSEPAAISFRRGWNRILFLFSGALALALLGAGELSAGWVEVPAAGPSARTFYGLAYDAARGETVLFGGYDSQTVFNDTWVWNGSAWSQKMPATSPSARYGFGMVYDSARAVCVLFGGFGGSFQGDTWEWDGTNWTQVATTGPGGRRAHQSAFDINRGVTVLFGGWSSGFGFDDTWEWMGAAGRIVRRRRLVNAPFMLWPSTVVGESRLCSVESRM